MSTLTYRGRQVCMGLLGTGGVPGSATELRLYGAGSQPSLAGTGFIDVPSAGGYAPWALLPAQWTTAESFAYTTLQLEDKTFTASADVGPILGAYLVDATGPLLWVQLKLATTVLTGNTFTLDGLRLSIR